MGIAEDKRTQNYKGLCSTLATKVRDHLKEIIEIKTIIKYGKTKKHLLLSNFVKETNW
jgi:hypothetical protein